MYKWVRECNLKKGKKTLHFLKIKRSFWRTLFRALKAFDFEDFRANTFKGGCTNIL